MQENRRSPTHSSYHYPHNTNQAKNLEASKPQITSDYRISEAEAYHNYRHNPFENLSYFQMLRVMLKENRLFFFHQILTGNFIKEVFKKFGLGCLCVKQNDNTDFVDSLFLKLYFHITPGCLPNLFRPFLFGLFVPMLVWFYLNYEYLKSDFYVSSVTLKVLDIFFVVMITLFIMIGFATGGNLKTDIWRYRSASICTEKPWIKSEQIYCADCKIFKPLRSNHCQYCQLCTPKYTKHSIVFNQCIGASNQIIYMAFQGLFFILVTLILALFVSPKEPLFHSFKVFIIRFIFFIINSYLQGMAGFQFLRGLLYTVNYNCTEYQVSNWSSKPYLCSFDRSRFYNPFQSKVTRHISSSLYGFFGCSDDDTEDRIQNWSKTYYYYPSHLRGHSQYMQWVLYCQQKQEKQKLRYNQITKQLQILYKIENIRMGSGSFQVLQQKHITNNELKNDQIPSKSSAITNQNDIVKGSSSQGLCSDDDIHSITQHDFHKDKKLLIQQRINKSVN